jgi:hypothetical protein
VALTLRWASSAVRQFGVADLVKFYEFKRYRSGACGLSYR